MHHLILAFFILHFGSEKNKLICPKCFAHHVLSTVSWWCSSLPARSNVVGPAGGACRSVLRSTGLSLHLSNLPGADSVPKTHLHHSLTQAPPGRGRTTWIRSACLVQTSDFSVPSDWQRVAKDSELAFMFQNRFPS